MTDFAVDYKSKDFNPLPPQGGRQQSLNVCMVRHPFQSTPSPRRETKVAASLIAICYISIHSLPKEGDIDALNVRSMGSDFNPLPPQGGRRQ